MPKNEDACCTAVSIEEPRGGGLFEGCYSSPQGTLSYRLYRAPALRKHPPLVVMLQGACQHESDFALGAGMKDRANECGAIVLYPEPALAASRRGNGFETRARAAAQGAPSMIAGMTRAVMSENEVDASRVYVAGMSAGGAMAVILGQTYPDLFAAVGVHSGVPSGVEYDFESAWSAMAHGPRPPSQADASLPEDALPPSVATIVFHGDCDTAADLSNAQAVHAQSRRVGAAITLRARSASETFRAPGGRVVTRVVQNKGEGLAEAELWIVHGGSPADALGPDASREMMRFFMQQRLGVRAIRSKAH